MSHANWLAFIGLIITSISAYYDASRKCNQGNDQSCMDLERMQNPDVR
jgi:hypothetical protein